MTDTNLIFTYTNWKGVTRVRTVSPISIIFKSTEYHREEQWIMRAMDAETNEVREFAMKDIEGINL